MENAEELQRAILGITLKRHLHVIPQITRIIDYILRTTGKSKRYETTKN